MTTLGEDVFRSYLEKLQRSGAQQCRTATDDSYLYESHHAHVLAMSLENAETPRETVLERRYPLRWHDAPGSKKKAMHHRVDLWCPATAAGPELWTEIKLAFIADRKTEKVWMQRAKDAADWWATDIWRLMVGADRGDRAFLLALSGGNWRPSFSRSGKSPKRRSTANADDVYDKIIAATRDCGSAAKTVSAFANSARDLLNASVRFVRVDGRNQAWDGALVIEWRQENRAASAYAAR